MSEFIVKLNNGFDERAFLKKLDNSFNDLNSKNVLINRSFKTFNYENTLYTIFKVFPMIPNIPKVLSLILLGLFGGFWLLFGRPTYFLLIGSSIFFTFSLVWSKYFFAFLMKRSIKKFGIKYVEVI